MPRGGAREGSGRKVGWRKDAESTKSAQLYIRLTQSQKAQLDTAAHAAGVTVSAYVLQKLGL